MKKVASKSAVRVERVLLDARFLYTVGTDDPIWKQNKSSKMTAPARGSIVRVRPPATATDEKIAEVEAWLKGAGAAKVRVESQAQADVLVEAEDVSTASHADQREVVMQMAEKSRRKEELRQILDFYLVKVAL